LLSGKLPDPVRIVYAIREQHRSKQGAEKNRTQPIVVCLTGRQREMDRQPVGVHDRVNFACQTASQLAHMLLIVISKAAPCWCTRTT
jgi:hypothetical protein